jgi:hypothetical protein
MIKFGFNSSQLKTLANDLAVVLGVHFEAHESDFRGGEYFRAETPQTTLFLQTNYDPVDHEPFEHDWPQKHAVLYIDGLDERDSRLLVDRLNSKAHELGANQIR